MDNDIFKVRSCLRCIDSALNTYSCNFKKIFHATWIWNISLAIVLGFTSFISFPPTCSLSYLSNNTVTIPVLIIMSMTIFFLITRVSSGIVTMLNCDDIKNTTIRLLKVNALTFGSFIAISIFIIFISLFAMQSEYVNKLPSATRYIILGALIAIMLFVTALSFSPFIYSATRYIFNKDSKFKEVFGMYYNIGIHRLGFLFSLLLALTLLCAVIFVVLCIPAYITVFASNIDNYGVATGDSSGLPPYFVWLNFASIAIMTFIVQYIMIWVMFSFFYAYGNIEALSQIK